MSESKDLQTRLDALRGRFLVASDRWPNLESWLITWPEDAEPPEDGVIPIDGPSAVGAGEGPAGDLQFVDMAVAGSRCDTPAGRYRPGCAGMLLLRWDFHRPFGGRRDVIYDPSETARCCDRWKVLACEGAKLVDALPDGVLSADTLRWHGSTRWQLAVHEITEAIPITHEGYVCERIADVFLSAAQACARLAERGEGDEEAAEAVVFCGDGLYESGAEAIRLDGAEALVMEALVELHAATKDQLAERSGVADAVRVLKGVAKKYSLLAPHIILPGGKSAGGYRTTIQRK